MSEVRLIVCDAQRTVCGTCHGGCADRLVAALSAEPETIEELEAALERFLQPEGRSMFACWSGQIDEEPWDAGFVVIDHERARMPEGISAREAMVDHDCPLCQMMADMPGPMFWGLDGSSMDDEFAFSFHRTQEEWDAQQREYEEMSRRWRESDAERERLGVKHSGADDANEPLTVRLFSVGCLLAELIVDLKERQERRTWIDALNRDWGNLREVCQGNDLVSSAALIEPVLDHFGGTLCGLGEAEVDLADKCDDLAACLRRFLEPPGEAGDEFHDTNYDDIPF